MTARYSRKRLAISLALVLAALTAWALHHALALLAPSSSHNLTLLWFISFIVLAWGNILASLEKPKTTTAEQDRTLDRLSVAVLVPAYNEDTNLLKACIQSIADQSRRPQTIVVVDDGSNKVDYAKVQTWAEAYCHNKVQLLWQRTPNKGKRHAQAVGVKLTTKADIYVTVDSDTVLDSEALREGLKPFTDPSVQSVAGVLLAINQDVNLLTRFSGVWEVAWQLIDRSSMSVLNSVMVNSGPLALYRGHTIRRYLRGYTNEQFFNRPVHFSDDSLLTTYALIHGKTVQQPTSLCFSATPEKVSHHIRRYVRWMRGSFIRTWWRFKYLPVDGWAYWVHMLKWAQMLLSAVIFWYLVYTGSFVNPAALPWLIGVPILISYLTSVRYLIVSRSDQSRRSQLCNYLLSPVALLWSMTVLRAVKWYSYATCLKTGWGTRQDVEVGITTS